MRGRTGFVVAAALAAVAPLQAQVAWQLGDQAWCDRGGDGGSSARACEVRTASWAPSGRIEVDGRLNGGIEVEAWDGNQVEIVARVSARAPSAERADELLRAVSIQTEAGRLEADGPDTQRRESWGVSYRLRVPRSTDLELRTLNGGISVQDVSGDIDFRATNGGVTLVGLGGDVRGRTTNGGLHVELDGNAWSGAGMDVETTNGGVDVSIPEGYSAELVVATTNGGIDVDFPVTVRGRIGRQLRSTLGDGGSTVRAVTTNGGVRVSRR